MRRPRRSNDHGYPLSKRRRPSLWARLERPSLWVVFGLLGGGSAGALSLEPQALERLSNAMPSWSSHSPSGAGPLVASTVQVATAPVALAPPAAPIPAAHRSVAKPLVAPAPEGKADDDEARGAKENPADALEEEDGPLWDPSLDPSGGGAWSLAARSVAPGQTWQDAANIADWPNVAQLIDALPVEQREEPGARYARAVAARELGQCKIALLALQDLESKLPLLTEEIHSARAFCQLELGPYQEAFDYFTRDPSPENLIQAARASLNGGELARAQLTIERAFQKIRRQGSETRQGHRNEIAARALRARILEARQQPKVAARDWQWLATEAPGDERARLADEAYERLSGERFTKQQRMERLRAFGNEGRVDQALRESRLLAAAPGAAPPQGDVTGYLGWAYYHSRQDYGKAAELFRAAAEQSEDARVKYLFFAARALSRDNLDQQAISAYQELAQRYPSSPYAEQAYYRTARLYYGLGQWDKAERAYNDYLDRYGRSSNGERATTSRFELAVTRLAERQRTDEAARVFNQLARKERNAQRRAFYSHLEAVALETTQDPRKVGEATERYRAIIAELPLSFAAMASAARLRALGQPEVHRVRLPSTFSADFAAGALLPELPDKARFLAQIGLHTDAERALFDQRNEVRRRYSDRDRETLCQMFGSLDRGYRSYAIADRWLKSDELRRPPSSETLWAWRCAYPKPYNTIVESVERRYQLPESLVYAVMRQESAFRPNVVSPAGAVGLMQLMPYTARRAADELTQQPGAPWVPDPHRPTNVLNNVELGGFYLSKLLALLGGQMPVAIAAYNAGPLSVSHWLETGEELPVDVWVAHIPFEETRDYVSLVLSNWLAYRYLGNPTELPELSLALKHDTLPQALADAY
jgi:soluble lytic murein transglycosylase